MSRPCIVCEALTTARHVAGHHATEERLVDAVLEAYRAGLADEGFAERERLCPKHLAAFDLLRAVRR